MLTSVRRLIGMPVLLQNRKLGYVEHAYAGQEKLEGIVIRHGIGSARWLPAEDILEMRRECVVASCKPSALPQLCPKRADRACGTDGRWVGEVSDWILFNNSPRFAAVEVSPGPIYRLMGHCGYACDFYRERLSGSVIVPRLLSWSQLKRLLEEGDDG